MISGMLYHDNTINNALKVSPDAYVAILHKYASLKIMGLQIQ